MKKGFALLETIIVITILSVSLLMLYGTFRNMILNTQKNILYDDASNIYEAYYLKEYLSINGLTNLIDSSLVKEISCNDFSLTSCNKLVKEMNINKIYLVSTSYDGKDSEYNSTLNNYILSLSNNVDYNYRFVIEYIDDSNYSYASIGVSYE